MDWYSSVNSCSICFSSWVFESIKGEVAWIPGSNGLDFDWGIKLLKNASDKRIIGFQSSKLDQNLIIATFAGVLNPYFC